MLTHGSDIASYSWSPDGKAVAFLATEPASRDKKMREDQGFTEEIYEEDGRFTRVWIAHPGEDKPPRMLKLTGSASEPSCCTGRT